MSAPDWVVGTVCWSLLLCLLTWMAFSGPLPGLPG